MDTLRRIALSEQLCSDISGQSRVELFREILVLPLKKLVEIERAINKPKLTLVVSNKDSNLKIKFNQKGGSDSFG